MKPVKPMKLAAVSGDEVPAPADARRSLARDRTAAVGDSSTRCRSEPDLHVVGLVSTWMLSMKRMRCGSVCMIERAGADAVAEEAHALHQRAVGDAGGGEDDVLARARGPATCRPASKSVMPIARQRSSSSGLLTTSRAKISPFRQRIAAAVSTPSGAPPMPITACTPRADDRRRDAGRQVAVADQPDARAGGADVGDQLLVARPVEHDDDQVVDVAVERRARSRAGCRAPARRGSTTCFELGPTTSFSM